MLMRKHVLALLIVAICLVVMGVVVYKTNVADEDVPYILIEADSWQCGIVTAVDEFQHRDPSLPLLSKQLIIETQEQYDGLRACARGSCGDVFPDVDFSRYTILGQYSSGSCAVRSFSRSVTINHQDKTLSYKVKPKRPFLLNFTGCSGPGKYSMNLVIVPKVPVGYRTVFASDIEPGRGGVEVIGVGGCIPPDVYDVIVKSGGTFPQPPEICAE